MRYILFFLAFISMLVANYMSLMYAPTEKVMGHIQRIFYFHMGTVWAATLAFILVFIASIMYLRKESRKWDIIAYSSAELGVLFITLTIITGSIWAKPVWGTWWTWDPQLTTTFILWVLYIVYLILRSSAGSNVKQARYSAIFAIIAFIDLPIVYASARLKRGISPVVFGPGGGGIAPEMMHTLLVCLVAFTLLFIVLLKERMNILKMKDIINSIKIRRNF
ncbi:MAG: cytochrome C assembly protein [Candidatus Dadabacteria bacterium]|nr:cytochrome C assembly protein [Candidatus Dadabacteria bacterium]NIQ14107.1 cytochrome C assembly protein [Candidatus Dadabacteria bacterium]